MQLVSTLRLDETLAILNWTIMVPVELINTCLVHWSACASLFIDLKVMAANLGIAVRQDHSSLAVFNVRYHWLQLRWHKLLQLLQVNLVLALYTLQRIESTFQVLLSFFELLNTMSLEWMRHGISTA